MLSTFVAVAFSWFAVVASTSCQSMEVTSLQDCYNFCRSSGAGGYSFGGSSGKYKCTCTWRSGAVVACDDNGAEDWHNPNPQRHPRPATKSCKSMGITSKHQCSNVCFGYSAMSMSDKVECICSGDDSHGWVNGDPAGCSDFNRQWLQWISDHHQALLNWHNVYRCMHWGTGHLLTWDWDIAFYAQKWADLKRGHMEHSSHARLRVKNLDGYDALGENLWRRADPEFGRNTPDAKEVVKDWYDEIHSCNNGGHVSSIHDSNGGVIGHYTQVIWKDTKSLGCGIRDNMVVCEYGPGGNNGKYSDMTSRPKYTQASCENYICGGSCSKLLAASDEASNDVDSASMLDVPFPAVVAVAGFVGGVAGFVGVLFLARSSRTLSPQPLLG